jgi:membrane peptidoglycan carboxypeptidase
VSNLVQKFPRLLVLVAGFSFVAGVFLFGFAYFTVSIPDPNAYVNSQATIIQYSDGSEIGRIGSENRTVVSLAEIPIHVRNAVMAAEDRNFYSNRAINPLAIAAAVWDNVVNVGQGRGGSTITQQYAKTAFLTPERSIQRKVKELVIAIKLENQFTKDEILENYLNTIYFGRGSYGVQTASSVYFGTTVDKLNIAQAAVLASILRSPGLYDPGFKAENLPRLEARFAYVLDGMVEQEWLEKEKAAKIKFPIINPRVTSGALAGPKGYVISWVERELNELGFTDEQLMIGGYIIKTTLVKEAQEAAVFAVSKEAPTKAPENLHIGLVAIKPGTGEILAMYGGQDYLKYQFNAATQGITSGGSSFKAFTLIAALEQGIPLSSVWNGDSPKVYDDGIGRPYPVNNYGEESWGNLSLLTATEKSVNTVYVPLGMKAGLEKVVDVARRAGIPQSVEMVASPSVSLGSASPHVIDLASAYATFASQGVYAKPFIINEVQGPNKGILYQGRIQAQEVFNKDVMADLTYALSRTTQSGTAAVVGARVARPTAGKTGTSNDNASAWFNGYTPEVAASVAFYRDDATQSLNGIGGLTSVTGGSFPARIWAEFVKKYLAKAPIQDFPPPVFIGGTEPVSYIDAVAEMDPALIPPSPTPSPTSKKKR